MCPDGRVHREGRTTGSDCLLYARQSPATASCVPRLRVTAPRVRRKSCHFAVCFGPRIFTFFLYSQRDRILFLTIDFMTQFTRDLLLSYHVEIIELKSFLSINQPCSIISKANDN